MMENRDMQGFEVSLRDTVKRALEEGYPLADLKYLLQSIINEHCDDV
jgi:hypothetical protein